MTETIFGNVFFKLCNKIPKENKINYWRANNDKKYRISHLADIIHITEDEVKLALYTVWK